MGGIEFGMAGTVGCILGCIVVEGESIVVVVCYWPEEEGNLGL